MFELIHGDIIELIPMPFRSLKSITKRASAKHRRIHFKYQNEIASNIDGA